MSEITSETVQQRLDKIKDLEEIGVDAYGRKFEVSHKTSECKEHYQEGKSVRLAGRLMALRGHGKSIFGNLSDASGSIQIYVKKDALEDGQFPIFKKANVGDILGVEGELFQTKTGEVTVWIKRFVFLGKALRPLPEKWHGLKDVETRFRQRYLDLISSPEVRDLFYKRTQIISGIRRFLDQNEFMEVETPMMHHIAGGAVAKPFITHHESLDIDLYLRIAPELFLKRLLVGGFEKIYEINRNFRNEGLSRFHNPEFSMLELYSAYDDYNDMMKITKDLVHFLCQEVLKMSTFKRPESEVEIRLDGAWERKGFFELLEEHTGVNWYEAQSPKKIILDRGLLPSIPDDWSDIDAINEVFEKNVQDKLIQPTFVIDYPTELCPLTKTKVDDPSRAERFELFIAGIEIANAYSELNDAIEQRRRFEKQAQEQGKIVDEEFLTALEHGMPCAGGLGIGIDRLVMILCNAPSIREVILFPQLRPEQDCSCQS